MSIILFITIAYLLYVILRTMDTKTNKLKFYASRFKIGFPENLSKKEKDELINTLLEYDTPDLPEDKLFEFIAARLRTIPFPEVTSLWKDDEYIII